MMHLDELHALGVLSALDVHLARTLGRLGDERDPRVLLAAALASRASHHGHVCVELVHPPPLPDGSASWPAPSEWAEALRSSPLVGDGSTARPLVLDGGARLYTRRYWLYQQRLAHALRQRALLRPATVDKSLLRAALGRLFPPGGVEPDLQRVAAAVAVLRGLTVVSGGPGTGKTWTVTKVLALLQEQAGTLPLRVALVAPTGKAAARLAESISAHRDDLDVPEAVRQALPTQASTIHRALGYRGRTPTRFRHHAGEPLDAHVVVVDEASMVDLALMSKLVDAVPIGARLVLLGDRNQLASVEAGAILGDICAVEPGFSTAFAGELGDVTGVRLGGSRPSPGIHDCIVHLTHSWRFDAASGIGGLAAAVNCGDGPRAVALLDEGGAGVRRVEGPLGATLSREVIRGFAPCVRERDPGRALASLGDFRVLCAHRRGPRGAVEVNRWVRACLARAGHVPSTGEWYPGRPVLVTRNDHQVGLFNGDVGVALPTPGGRVRVYFPTPTGVRDLSPARLPPHQTAYALTIHKSQGSEYDRVAVVLPGAPTRVLSRELLYTGITRARREVVVSGSRDVVEAATARPVRRASGLRDALQAPPQSPATGTPTQGPSTQLDQHSSQA